MTPTRAIMEIFKNIINFIIPHTSPDFLIQACVKSEKIPITTLWKVGGALQKPNGRTL
jgi:hypothetical protein